MKIKSKSLVGAVILCVASLTGCSEQEQHTHKEVTRYNDEYHWTICEICNKLMSEKVTHTITTEVTKAPKCDEKGQETHKCDCGFSQIYYISATGHKYKTEYSYNETSHYHECEICHDKTDIEDHNLLEEILEEPTEKKEGKKRVYCDKCSYEKFVTLSNISTTENILEILPNEVNDHPYLEMNGVYLNEQYPIEFTIQKGSGYIKSDKLGAISEITIHLYGYYNNVTVYDNITGGNQITGTKETKYLDSTPGNLFTYDLNGATSFRIENTANYDANAFSITIKHSGKVENPNYEEISISKALEIGSALTGVSEKSYIVSGKITAINDELVTISDGNNSLVVENKYVKNNMNLDYKVKLKGKIENRDGQILLTNISLQSYDPAKYGVQIQASEHGLLQVDKYSDLSYDDRVKITIIPDEGYRIKTLYVNGIKQHFYNNLASFLIKQNTLITAEFTKDYGENTIESEYVFSSYDSGVDKKENEEHTLDDNTKITVNNSFFSSNLIIYENGSALIESKGAIKEITIKTTATIGSLSIYGKESDTVNNLIASISNDGVTEYTYDISDKNYTTLNIVSTSGTVSLESISLVHVNTDTLGNFVIHSIEMVGTYGDSNLITYGNYDILIDGGTASDSSNLKKAIDTYVIDGVLDLLIITHPDSDHYGGITSGNPFVNLMDVKMMVTGDDASNDSIVDSVKSKFPDLEDYNISELVSEEKKTHTLSVDDKFSIDFLWHPGYSAKSKNNQSVATLLKYKNTKLFMAGDMEKAECNNFIPTHPNLTSEDDFVIFKALHHASNGSNDTNFIEYIKPDFAFVTAGMKLSDPDNTPNYSAHPYLDASIRIGNYTTQYYWSGVCGQLNIVCNGYTATAKGLGRSKDYYVYNKNTGEYIKADKEKEKTVTYFESYFYQNAIVNMDKPNLAGVSLYC